MQTSTNQNIELSTELKDLFSYSIIPIIILAGILIILIIIYIIICRNKTKKRKTPIVISPNSKDRNQIKKHYLEKLNKLSLKVEKGTIQNRKAYQELSKLIRTFIYEMTSIQVQNYTLADIKKINMPVLYELVNEYYDPEFSKISKGNIINSIEKTRKVIESWS